MFNLFLIFRKQVKDKNDNRPNSYVTRTRLLCDAAKILIASTQLPEALIG